MSKRLTVEERTEAILKPSPTQGLAFITPTTDLAPKEVRGKYIHKPRIRAKDEAAPRIVIHHGTYDGAELKPFEGRPGAMDFKKCKSKGF